jgi:hypothetical protein
MLMFSSTGRFADPERTCRGHGADHPSNATTMGDPCWRCRSPTSPRAWPGTPTLPHPPEFGQMDMPGLEIGSPRGLPPWGAMWLAWEHSDPSHFFHHLPQHPRGSLRGARRPGEDLVGISGTARGRREREDQGKLPRVARPIPVTRQATNLFSRAKSNICDRCAWPFLRTAGPAWATCFGLASVSLIHSAICAGQLSQMGQLSAPSASPASPRERWRSSLASTR